MIAGFRTLTAAAPIAGEDLSAAAYRRSLAGVLAAAVVLGMIRLATPAVWLDEASSWYNVSGSWTHLWQRVIQGEDSGGLFYSVLLKSWTAAAGTSEFSLRLPGIVLLVALIAALARAVRVAYRRDAAVLTAAAALLHPSVLPAARQARGYILVLFLTALAVLALAEHLAGRRRRAAWLAVAAALGVTATHVFGIFVAIGAAACHASIASFASVPATARRRTVGRYGVAAAAALPALLFAIGWAMLIQERVQRNLTSFWIQGTAASNYVAIAVLLVAPLALACAWLGWRDRSPRARAVACGLALMALPIAAGPGLVSVFATGGGHLVLLRYALALAPLGAAAAGCALTTIPRRLAVPLVVLGLAASVGYSASKNVYSAEARAGQDIREAAAYLRSEAGSGDMVFVEPANNWMALAYYGVDTRPVEGMDEGWRSVGARASTPFARVWLVRFSRRTSAPQDLLQRATGGRRFGTLTILESAVRWEPGARSLPHRPPH